jgi:hypothetical protein
MTASTLPSFASSTAPATSHPCALCSRELAPRARLFMPRPCSDLRFCLSVSARKRPAAGATSAPVARDEDPQQDALIGAWGPSWRQVYASQHTKNLQQPPMTLATVRVGHRLRMTIARGSGQNDAENRLFRRSE